MSGIQKKLQGRARRRKRTRERAKRGARYPRLAFFRSNKHVYAQVIDDSEGKTLFGASSAKGGERKNATEAAEKIGAEIAEKAAEKKIQKVVFDRGGFVYTGSVKTFAEAARAGGLQF